MKEEAIKLQAAERYILATNNKLTLTDFKLNVYPCGTHNLYTVTIDLDKIPPLFVTVSQVMFTQEKTIMEEFSDNDLDRAIAGFKAFNSHYGEENHHEAHQN